PRHRTIRKRLLPPLLCLGLARARPLVRPAPLSRRAGEGRGDVANHQPHLRQVWLRRALPRRPGGATRFREAVRPSQITTPPARYAAPVNAAALWFVLLAADAGAPDAGAPPTAAPAKTGGGAHQSRESGS